MPPFAPRLNPQISIEQAIPEPVGPSAGAAIGDAFGDIAKIAGKYFEDNKPRKVTYSEIKDQSDLATFQEFQRGMDQAEQLDKQGFRSQADALRRRTEKTASFNGADITKDQYKGYYSRTTGNPEEQMGMSDQEYQIQQAKQTPQFKAAHLASLEYPDMTDAQRESFAMNRVRQIASAASSLELSKTRTDADKAINHGAWDKQLFPAYTSMIDEGIGALVGSALQASREGRPLDPLSLVNAEQMVQTHLRDVFKNNPRPIGVDDAQWAVLTKYAKGLTDAMAGLVNKKDRISSANAANYALVVAKSGLGTTGKHVMLSMDAEKLAAAASFPWQTVLQTLHEAEQGAADGAEQGAVDGTSGVWTLADALGGKRKGGKNPPGNKTIPDKTLNSVTGSPEVIAKQVKDVASVLNNVDLSNLAKNRESLDHVGLWSSKLAASVHQSTKTFAVQDIRNVYDGRITQAFRAMAKQKPKVGILMFRQHQEALDSMASKALAAIASPGDGAFNVNEDGNVSIDHDTIARKYSRGPLLSRVAGDMKEALAPFNGDFGAFKKAYEKGTAAEHLGAGGYGRSAVDQLAPTAKRFDYSPAVQWFMSSSPDMKEYESNLEALTAQSESLREIRNTSKRMGREADRIQAALDLDEGIADGDNAGVTDSLVYAPEPRRRPVDAPTGEKSLAARFAEGVTGSIVDGVFKPAFTDQSAAELFEGVTGAIVDGVFKPAFADQSAAAPDTNGVPLGERAGAGALDNGNEATNGSWAETAKAAIKKHEGKRLEAYPDRGGYAIGYGRFGVLKNAKITDEQAESYFEEDFQAKVAAARKAIPKFDSLSDELKAEITQGFFRGDLSGSPKALALINEGKFSEAAVEFLNNNEYRSPDTARGVKNRMLLIANALELESNYQGTHSR